MAASAPLTPKVAKTSVLPMVPSSMRFVRLDATKMVILLSVRTAVLKFVMKDPTQFLKVASKLVAHQKHNHQPIFLQQRPRIPSPPLVPMAALAPSTQPNAKSFVQPTVRSLQVSVQPPVTKMVNRLWGQICVLLFVKLVQGPRQTAVPRRAALRKQRHRHLIRLCHPLLSRH